MHMPRPSSFGAAEIHKIRGRNWLFIAPVKLWRKGRGGVRRAGVIGVARAIRGKFGRCLS